MSGVNCTTTHTFFGCEKRVDKDSVRPKERGRGFMFEGKQFIRWEMRSLRGREERGGDPHRKHELVRCVQKKVSFRPLRPIIAFLCRLTTIRRRKWAFWQPFPPPRHPWRVFCIQDTSNNETLPEEEGRSWGDAHCTAPKRQLDTSWRRVWRRKKAYPVFLKLKFAQNVKKPDLKTILFRCNSEPFFVKKKIMLFWQALHIDA